MNVLISDAVADSTVEALNAKPNLTVNYKPGVKGDELTEAVKEAEILVIRSGTKANRELIENAPNLKAIIRGGVGIDNIDQAAAKEKGVAVHNTPAATSISVAELVLSLMLGLVRRLPAADRSMKGGKWEKKAFKGKEINGKTLGILGIGRIGAEVAKRAFACGMHVQAYDPYLEDDQINARGAKAVDLETIIRSSDFITLHLPLTDETQNLISKSNIDKMRNGAYIINCARGGVINEHDLLDALNSGKIAGAGLDVYEEEPTKFQELISHGNVIATPHIGAATHEGQARVGDEVIAIIDEIMGGR